MLRKVGAVVAGIFVVFCVVTAIQLLSGRLFPLPEGVTPFDPADAEAFAAYVRALPTSAWLLALGSELLGAFLGGLTAGWIARERGLWVSGTVVALAMAASVMNWWTFSHPVWFIATELIGYALVFVLVLGIGRRRSPAAASD
jgi:hypothetical protein